MFVPHILGCPEITSTSNIISRTNNGRGSFFIEQGGGISIKEYELCENSIMLPLM